jgi:hypothetical protein
MGAGRGDEALGSTDEPTLQQPPLAPEPAPIAAKEPVRRSAIEERLRKLDRLPPNHRYLSVAILKSIALMYDEIRKHRGRVARAQCVRACFSNEAHLRAGILALLELLDPTSSGLLLEAPSEELIDALLMQERAIWQRARSRRAGAPAHGVHGAPSRRVSPDGSGTNPADDGTTAPAAEPALGDERFAIPPPAGEVVREPSKPNWRH